MRDAVCLDALRFHFHLGVMDVDKPKYIIWHRLGCTAGTTLPSHVAPAVVRGTTALDVTHHRRREHDRGEHEFFSVNNLMSAAGRAAS